MNEIVKYENTLNSIAFREFNSGELDIFFALVSRMRDKGEKEIRFSFEKLRELTKSGGTETLSNRRFFEQLKSTYKKMLKMTWGYEQGLYAQYFVLFTGFEIDGEKGYVDIQVNQKLTYILNELQGFFTRYELAEFAELKSKYAKNLYRLLKQFRHTGLLMKTPEDFKLLMDIPKSYQPINIDKRVIEPAMAELTPLFKDLTFTKRRAKRYNRITHYEFKFEPEPRINEDFTAKNPDEVQKSFNEQNIPF